MALSPMAKLVGELMGRLEELQQYVVFLEDRVEQLENKTDNRKKLRPFEVRQIRALWKTGQVTQAELADQYNVNPATISRIVRGIYYAA
jgi:helix-turn-helix, Psq domain.